MAFFAAASKMVAFLLAILLLVSGLHATDSVKDVGPFSMGKEWEGYAEGLMMFKGEFAGHHIEYNGTIEQVFAHFSRLHRDVDLNFLHLNTTVSTYGNHNLDSREATAKDGIICCPVPGQNWLTANIYIIGNGIDYLRAALRLLAVLVLAHVFVSAAPGI